MSFQSSQYPTQEGGINLSSIILNENKQAPEDFAWYVFLIQNIKQNEIKYLFRYPYLSRELSQNSGQWLHWVMR